RRGAEKGAGGQQEDRRVQDLSRRTARLPCRLSRELSQGSRRRWLEPDAGLVQEVWRAGLSIGASFTRMGSDVAGALRAKIVVAAIQCAAASLIPLTAPSPPRISPARGRICR